MAKTHLNNKPLIVAIAAVTLAVAGALFMSGCQTATQPSGTLTPKLESGTTITDGTLTVGVNASNTPYGGTNTNKEMVGLDVDVAAAIADELGMKVQVVDVGASGRGALTDKKADVVLGMSKSGSDDTLTYSSAYIEDGLSLFALSENAPESVSSLDLKGEKIIVQSESAAAYTIQAALGIESISTASTMQEAFEALQNGDHKYLVTNAVIGSYFARDYSDVVRVDFTDTDSVTPVYAATLTANAQLATAITDAVDTIAADGVLGVIEAKWLGTNGEALLPSNVDTSALPSTVLGS